MEDGELREGYSESDSFHSTSIKSYLIWQTAIKPKSYPRNVSSKASSNPQSLNLLPKMHFSWSTTAVVALAALAEAAPFSVVSRQLPLVQSVKSSFPSSIESQTNSWFIEPIAPYSIPLRDLEEGSTLPRLRILSPRT